MKRKAILILSVFCLTSCLGLNLSPDDASEGLYNGRDIVEQFEYTSYQPISKEMPINVIGSILMHKEESTQAINRSTDLLPYLDDNNNIIDEIVSFSNLAKNPQGLRVGDIKKSIRGQLEFSLNQQYEAVVIKAVPYNNEVDTLEGTDTVIDEDVRLGVNELGFQTIVASKIDEELQETELTYIFPEPTDTFKVVAGPYRAVITSITFYN